MKQRFVSTVVLVVLLFTAVWAVALPVPPLPALRSWMGFCNEGWMVKVCTSVEPVAGGYKYFYEFSTDQKEPVRAEVTFTKAQWQILDHDQFEKQFKFINTFEQGSGDVTINFLVQPKSTSTITAFDKNGALPHDARKQVSVLESVASTNMIMAGAQTFYIP